MSRRTRVLVGFLLAIPPVLVALVAGAWILLPQFVLGQVERQAAEYGVDLSECEIELGWKSLTLIECRFAVAQANEISGTVARIRVTLDGLAPKSVEASGAAVTVRGSPAASHLFEKRKPSLGQAVPVTVTDSKLEWVPEPNLPPRLSLTELEYSAPSGAFSSKLDVANRLVGTVSRQGDLVEAVLALPGEPSAKLQLRIEQGKSRGELRLDFEQLALSKLDGPLLQVPKDLQQVRMSGQIYADVPIGLDPKPGKGDLRLIFDGLNFPVPRELQGLVYGTPVELSGRFALDRSMTKAKLSKLRLTVGALAMQGKGSAEWKGDALAFETSLSGALSCSAIVRSAAAAHVDSELAKVAGSIARMALDGSVRLIAFVRGSTDRLDKVEVVKSVGVGCGLKPLPLLDDLTKLPRELLELLPELPNLPALPGRPGKDRDGGKPGDTSPPKERPTLRPPKLTLPTLPLPKLPDLSGKRVRDDPTNPAPEK